MQSLLTRRALVALGACAVVVGSTVAVAAVDDRTAALSTLASVESSPNRTAAKDFVARSRNALERATRLRTAGDEQHAKLSERVALRWAEAARDVAETAGAEQRAAELALRALDAGALADRERALLEEANAQAGRLRAQLERERETTAVPAAKRSKGVDGGSP